MKEVWVENNGYKISNYGKVTKKHKDELQKMSIGTNEYAQCDIKFKDGFHARSVHRAVAYAFLKDTYKEGLEVNHIDGNKENNRVDNLEWVTKSENQQHEAKIMGQRNGDNSKLRKLTEKEVIEIYNMIKYEGVTNKEVAEIYNVKPTNVCKIIRGTRWKHLGLEPFKTKDKKIIGINIENGYIVTYDSSRFAEVDGFSKSCISGCCTGKTKSHKGYIWAYNI